MTDTVQHSLLADDDPAMRRVDVVKEPHTALELYAHLRGKGYSVGIHIAEGDDGPMWTATVTMLPRQSPTYEHGRGSSRAGAAHAIRNACKDGGVDL